MSQLIEFSASIRRTVKFSRSYNINRAKNHCLSDCRSKPEAATKDQAGWLVGRQASNRRGDNLTTRGEKPVFHGGLSRKLRVRRYDEPKG